MPNPLTDNTNNFPTVVVPAGGDARTAASVQTPFQHLADRTGTLNARLNPLRQAITFTAAGSGLSPGTQLTLTTVAESVPGSFALTGNQINVPATGLYLVTITGNASCSSTANPTIIGATFSSIVAQVVRYSASAAESLFFTGSQILQLTAGNNYPLVVGGGAGTLTFSGTRLALWRIS
jgi:hypothetical protein